MHLIKVDRVYAKLLNKLTSSTEDLRTLIVCYDLKCRTNLSGFSYYFHRVYMSLRPLLLLTRFLLILWLPLSGCSQDRSTPPEKLTVGVVSYDTEALSVNDYEHFQEYLAKQTSSVVELEPALNELNAVQQVRSKAWSIVFAPPGLAAIAIGTENYTPIFRMEGVNNLRSVLVVREDSPIKSIGDIANKAIALEEPGSAAGYYLPLYDLYGLTLAEVRFAPTPKTVLAWLSQDTVAVGALSENDFDLYQHEFGQTKFRILHTSRFVPPAVVLLAPTLDRNQEEQIKAVMRGAPSSITGDAHYIPNAKLPDYDQFIQIVKKVKPLEVRVREKPVVLLDRSL